MRHESPADAIRRVGEVWTATDRARGLRSEPSPVAMYDVVTRSTVRFIPNQPWSDEKLEVTETYELRTGERYDCRAAGETRVEYQFAWQHGEAAVEMRRPAIRLMRTCQPPGFPEAELSLEGTVGRFRLKGDQLSPYAPPLEQRVYLPVQ